MLRVSRGKSVPFLILREPTKWATDEKEQLASRSPAFGGLRIFMLELALDRSRGRRCSPSTIGRLLLTTRPHLGVANLDRTPGTEFRTISSARQDPNRHLPTHPCPTPGNTAHLHR